MSHLKSHWLNHVIHERQNHQEEVGLIGAKAEGLKILARLGISVPSGFVINNKFAKHYFVHGIAKDFLRDLMQWTQWLQEVCNRYFYDNKKPFFVSMRSSPCVSMPGLLTTVLNVGMCSQYLDSPLMNLPGFVDNYGHWLRSFYNITRDKNDPLLSWPDCWSASLVHKFTQNQYIRDCPWLNNIELQIKLALEHILYVFQYHAQNQNNGVISTDFIKPPGIIIQQMVWGNSNDRRSGTGVAFSRNPHTGKNEIFGDFAINTIGEKLVLGICQAIPLWSKNNQDLTMHKLMPDLFYQLQDICRILENHCGCLQDIEFTVDNSRLWILQTRKGKCTARANVNITLDLLKEKKIIFHEAVNHISAQDISTVTKVNHAYYTEQDVLAHGQALTTGVVSGLLCFDDQDIQYCIHHKKNIIFVSKYSNDVNFDLLRQVKGLLTIHSTSTSHIVVVARGLDVACISDLDLSINIKNKTCTLHFKNHVNVRTSILKARQVITMDGNTGNVIQGNKVINDYFVHNDLHAFLRKLSKQNQIDILANINSSEEIDLIKNYNFSGVGLCRTEYMLNEQDLFYLQAYYLSNNNKIQQDCLNKLFCSYEKYFNQLLSMSINLPVTIRLLDMPLYEFLPQNQQQIKDLCDYCGDNMAVHHKLEQSKKDGGMLGLRGVRFGIIYSDFYRMQVKAIMRSWCNFPQARVKILLPFISLVAEVEFMNSMIRELYHDYGPKNTNLAVGVMWETPAALLLADVLATKVQFFSFGTNDLSQLLFGVYREDTNLINAYFAKSILSHDLFLHVQHDSILSIMTTACRKARSVNSDIEIGLCGEGELTRKCADFLFREKINYISCAINKIPAVQFKVGQMHLSRR